VNQICRLYLSLVIISAFCSASQVDAGPSFAGKSISVVIGNAAGGTTDIVGRLMAQTLMQYLPGNPKMIVDNRPGAEGVTALNSFFREAMPDGLTITVGAATQSDPLFIARHTQYMICRNSCT
jgi:tripartite-type tricarboxylate transporter receptor subunit TctC